MQAKVPQNVDIEDRVVGALTLRQFMIIFCTVAFSAFLYIVIGAVSKVLWFMITAIIGTGAMVLAFYKYGDQNLEVFAMSALKTFQLPTKRVWRKGQLAQATEAVLKKEEPKKDPRKKNVTEVRADLARLAELVDSGGSSVVPPHRVAGETTIQNNTDTGEAKDVIETAMGAVDNLISKITVKPTKNNQDQK